MQLRECESMDEDKDKKYVIRSVIKDEPLASPEKEGTSEPAQPQLKEPQPTAEIPQTSQKSKPWQRIPFSQIPTEKIFKTMTNKDMMMQTLHDETMEPHVHIAILLLIVMVLAIIISLLGI